MNLDQLAQIQDRDLTQNTNLAPHDRHALLSYLYQLGEKARDCIDALEGSLEPRPVYSLLRELAKISPPMETPQEAIVQILRKEEPRHEAKSR